MPYVYLIRKHLWEKGVFKIGCSKSKSTYDRIKSYGTKAQILALIEVNDCREVEKNLKLLFNSKFILIEGKEHFKGNEDEIKLEFLKIVYNHQMTNSQKTTVDTVVESKVDTVVESKVDTVVESKVESKVDTVVESKVDTVVECKVDTVVESKVDTEFLNKLTKQELQERCKKAGIRSSGTKNDLVKYLTNVSKVDTVKDNVFVSKIDTITNDTVVESITNTLVKETVVDTTMKESLVESKVNNPINDTVVECKTDSNVKETAIQYKVIPTKQLVYQNKDIVEVQLGKLVHIKYIRERNGMIYKKTIKVVPYSEPTLSYNCVQAHITEEQMHNYNAEHNVRAKWDGDTNSICIFCLQLCVGRGYSHRFEAIQGSYRGNEDAIRVLYACDPCAHWDNDRLFNENQILKMPDGKEYIIDAIHRMND